MPEPTPAVGRTARASTPAAARWSSRRRPNSSSPTRPTMATLAPCRAASTAWLPPLPPGRGVQAVPARVSPVRGWRGASTMMSRCRLPRTTTSGVTARPAWRGAGPPARPPGPGARAPRAGRCRPRAGRRRRAAPDGGDVGLALRYRVEVGRVREGVEVEGALIAVAAQLTQQLDGLDRVDRGHHQAVVAAAVAVVEVDAQEPAAAGGEGGGEGGLLAGVEQVGEVERHAEVRLPGLLDREQRGAEVAEQAEGAGLARLVLDRDVDAGVVGRDLADALDLERPEPGVVALERVVEAVLAEPEGHEPPAGRGEGVDAALGQVDRGAADGRVRVGEGAGLKRRVAVVAHGEAVERQAEVGGDADRVGLVQVVRVVEVDGREAPHRGGARQELGHREAAGPAGTGLEGVEPGGEQHRGLGGEGTAPPSCQKDAVRQGRTDRAGWQERAKTCADTSGPAAVHRRPAAK